MWLAIVAGCGAAPAADTAQSVTRRASPSRPGTPPPTDATATSGRAPATPEVDAELDALRAWALSAPGREDATVERIEREADPGRSAEGPALHVIAHDGDVTLDAWIESTGASAGAYWRVAELVEIVRRARIDQLERDGGWALVTIEGSTSLCGQGAGAPCHALPTAPMAGLSHCARGRCSVQVDTGTGRIESWEIDPARRRRRLVRSWPARPDELEGAWDAGARAERGQWQRLERTDRPDVLDDPRLADPRVDRADDAMEDANDDEPCVPTVRSARRDDVIVRAVGCGDPSAWEIVRRPGSFVVTRNDRTEASPLFVAEPGPPSPRRVMPVGALAPDAIGFVASGWSGGSPSGGSVEELWVLLPSTPARGPRLHRIELGSTGTEGLGNEGDGEGYVVAVDRRRWTFEIVGPGVGRYTGCERWSGTHSRGTDRWRGERRAAPLDVRVAFDPDRGFEITHADRAVVRDACATEATREE